MVTLRPRNSKKAEKAVATAAKAKKEDGQSEGSPLPAAASNTSKTDQAEAQPKKQPTDNSDISYYESF
eukprot:CAMPEP_0196139618 /NCGR_PEP_ID=MMETSP0910-20130528/6831_1 /TAXON_ID=49265 /ORGANISM="Thalassiosira rotula, Strain GSO102" /LENGTH=67 /DNA_ID=CAMNT_0041400365 /DNA_START=77 /DNA_END=280 /DNA_ORIENTATION=-